MSWSRITLRDVAQRAGVHESTVSRALNPRTRHMVKPEVARRVTEAAGDLGYRPNTIALSLKTNRTMTVGVVIPDLTNPVFPPMIRGIEDALSGGGYTAIVANSDNDPGRERVILETMRNRRVDGLILATARREDALIADSAADSIPVVLINRTIENSTLSSVANDDAGGIMLAVKHLAGLGHRRIAHVAGPQGLSTGKRRYEGFLAAMATCGLDADPALIAATRVFSEEEGRRALGDILARGGEFTAVVAANDLLALGCYGALAEAELRCPEDISVTGFNDMPFSDKFNPPLTTIRIPLYEMGECAAEALLRRLADPDTRPESILLKRELVVRGSTGPAPKA